MVSPPSSVMRPPPSMTMSGPVLLKTLAGLFNVMVCGALPQLNVMMPPAATAVMNASAVQDAGVPVPTTRVGDDVSSACASGGTAQFPSGLPAAGADPLELVDAPLVLALEEPGAPLLLAPPEEEEVAAALVLPPPVPPLLEDVPLAPPDDEDVAGDPDVDVLDDDAADEPEVDPVDVVLLSAPSPVVPHPTMKLMATNHVREVQHWTRNIIVNSRGREPCRGAQASAR